MSLRKKLRVNKCKEFFARDAFGIGCPGAPAKLRRDRRAVAVLHQLQLLILVVDDFHEEHPAELGDALGIAIDAGILAHDVLDGFDGIANGHCLSFLLVEGGLEFLHREHEIRPRPEFLYELDRCSHRIERRDLQNPRVAQVDDTLILIFLQERFKHGAGLGAILGEDISFADTLCAFAARERGLVESDVADKVKRIEVLADFIGQRLKREAFVFEFFDNGLLAFGRLPALEEIIEAGKALLQGLLGEIPQRFGNEPSLFIEIFHALGDDGGPYPVHVDFARLVLRQH